MSVLLLAEHDNKSLAPATAKALAAAEKFGGQVDILVAGEGARGVAEAAAKHRSSASASPKRSPI
jgi:electron transfer flavoprotein alpha subunit